MRRAGEIMTKQVVAVPESMPLDELEELFLSEGVSGAPVKSESGKVIGIISKTDIIQAVRLQKSDKLSEFFAPKPKAVDIMSRYVHCVSANTSAREVAEIMIDKQIHRVLVGGIEDVQGIISSHDLLTLIR